MLKIQCTWRSISVREYFVYWFQITLPCATSCSGQLIGKTARAGGERPRDNDEHLSCICAGTATIRFVEKWFIRMGYDGDDERCVVAFSSFCAGDEYEYVYVTSIDT